MHLKLYSDPLTKTLDLFRVADEVRCIFSNCNIIMTVDVRPPFLQCTSELDLGIMAENIASTRIAEIRQPLDHEKSNSVSNNEAQKRYRCPSPESIAYEKNLITNKINNKNKFQQQHQQDQPNSILYDGFMLQRLLGSLIPDNENSIDNLHVIFDSRLTCTFSEDDWRYHGRAIICGTPSIISTTGIVEAPAKPREYYLKQMRLNASNNVHTEAQYYELEKEELKREFAGRYLEYEDTRINSVATGYVLQACFFFLANGHPFCDDKKCRLYNAHWQEDLIYCQIENPKLCKKHILLLLRKGFI